MKFRAAKKSFPIAWHKECLANEKFHLEREIHQIHEMQERIDRLKANVEFYERQIVTAEAQGREEFDSNKFLVVRKRKQ